MHKHVGKFEQTMRTRTLWQYSSAANRIVSCRNNRRNAESV